MNAVIFQNWICKLKFARYNNGRIAIELVNATKIKEDGIEYMPGTMNIARATVNLPDYPLLKSDEVIIKDYSENEGMLNALINAGVVAEPHSYVEFLHAPVCKLLVKPRM